MIRADVDGCGCGSDWDSDLDSLPVFSGIGAAAGIDGDVDSAPSPWLLFFFFAMTLEGCSYENICKIVCGIAADTGPLDSPKFVLIALRQPSAINLPHLDSRVYDLATDLYLTMPIR
jgi:hypothetical protein